MRTIIYLLLILTSMIGCKKDKIHLEGGDVHPDGGFLATFTFLFEKGGIDDYSFEFDASKSSPGLGFHQIVYVKNYGRGSEYKRFRLSSLGNKGVVKLDKNRKLPYKKEPYVMIGIDRKSIKIGKEQSFKIKVYQNDKIIDVKTVTFVTLLGPYEDRSIERAGYLKKLCISNWKKIEDVSKGSFLLLLKYPKGKYDGNLEALKGIKKTYDDCYVEDPDSDRY